VWGKGILKERPLTFGRAYHRKARTWKVSGSVDPLIKEKRGDGDGAAHVMECREPLFLYSCWGDVGRGPREKLVLGQGTFAGKVASKRRSEEGRVSYQMKTSGDKPEFQGRGDVKSA